MDKTINPTSSFDIYANYQIGKGINLMSKIDLFSVSKNLKSKMTEEAKKFLKIFEWAYKTCFVLALIWFVYIISPAMKNKVKNFNWFGVGGQVESAADSDLDLELAVTPKPTPDPATLPFSIEIAKIGVNDKVIPNVDAKNSTVYSEALEDGVAHGLNSAFPGQGEMIYIFGHSTDYEWNVETYNAIFYKIKDLEIGDEIILHHGSKNYIYQMYEQKITAKDDTEFVNNMALEDVLLLQTCYPPGTSWKRLIVLAKPTRVEENGKSGFELLINENE